MNNSRVKSKIKRFEWVLKDMTNEIKRCPQASRDELIDIIYEDICEFDKNIEEYTNYTEVEAEKPSSETIDKKEASDKKDKKETIIRQEKRTPMETKKKVEKPIKEHSIREAEVKVTSQSINNLDGFDNDCDD